jgi:hypothetical protein
MVYSHIAWINDMYVLSFGLCKSVEYRPVHSLSKKKKKKEKEKENKLFCMYILY